MPSWTKAVQFQPVLQSKTVLNFETRSSLMRSSKLAFSKLRETINHTGNTRAVSWSPINYWKCAFVPGMETVRTACSERASRNLVWKQRVRDREEGDGHSRVLLENGLGGLDLQTFLCYLITLSLPPLQKCRWCAPEGGTSGLLPLHPSPGLDETASGMCWLVLEQLWYLLVPLASSLKFL